MSDQETQCIKIGGKYLGGGSCQLANGTIAKYLQGEEARQAYLEQVSATDIPAGTAKSWALSTTAIFFELQNQDNNLLGGAVATSENRDFARKLLKDGWDISDYGSLLKNLVWLKKDGHRKQFDEMGKKLDTLSQSEFQKFLSNPDLSETEILQFKLVRRHHPHLGEKSILGWDLVRYIALCRLAFSANIMSEPDAWQNIMPAAVRLQKTFTSWDELQRNYLLGRKYWSPESSNLTREVFEKAYLRIMDDPESPWKQNPWNMDLSSPPAIPAATPKAPKH